MRPLKAQPGSGKSHLNWNTVVFHSHQNIPTKVWSCGVIQSWNLEGVMFEASVHSVRVEMVLNKLRKQTFRAGVAPYERSMQPSSEMCQESIRTAPV